jgi:hypothetical protein
MREVKNRRMKKKKRELLGVCALLFFALIITVCTGNYLTENKAFSLPSPSVDLMLFPVQDPGYVTSYLSSRTQKAILRDVMTLLEEKKVAVARIEMRTEDLEREKETFLVSMEHKQNMFHENLAIVDDPGLIEGLQTLVQLKKDRQSFNREMHRRVGIYLQLYEKKLKELEEKKNSVLVEIAELQKFAKALSEKTPVQSSRGNPDIFVSEVKRNLYRRFLFSIERGLYDRALEQLDLLLSLEWNAADAEQLSIVRGLLSVLTDYQKELNALKDKTFLDELKLSYLAEDYDVSLSRVEMLQKNGYMPPLLAHFRKTLYENITAEGIVMDEIEVKSRLKELSKKAERFEKEGEYGKAVKIYEDLLILNLPSYDREYLIQKLHSLMVPSLKNEIKRHDNTEAIKYLENARTLQREGRDNEAAEVYVKLIQNCPNSDYIEEAVSHILRFSHE